MNRSQRRIPGPTRSLAGSRAAIPMCPRSIRSKRPGAVLAAGRRFFDTRLNSYLPSGVTVRVTKGS